MKDYIVDVVWRIGLMAKGIFIEAPGTILEAIRRRDPNKKEEK